MKNIAKALLEEFDHKEVKWRIQGKVNESTCEAMAVAYIDARAVMDRLDEVFGVFGWQDNYYVAGSTTMCRMAVNVEGEWVSKEDGAGDTNIEAQKGALSDAFKRAAVKWGIGRYLYSFPMQWKVKCKKYGRSWMIINSEKARLASIVSGSPNITKKVTHGDLTDRVKGFEAYINKCKDDESLYNAEKKGKALMEEVFKVDKTKHGYLTKLIEAKRKGLSC